MNASARFLLGGLTGLLFSMAVHADTGQYRVEVLVFKQQAGVTQPAETDQLRGFYEAYPLGEAGPQPIPLPESGVSGQFESLWKRLSALSGYEPLVQVAWHQSRIDYQPAVRVHDDEVIAEELHFPGDTIYVDLTDPRMLQPYLARMYRLDGSIQLRRSRFLHLDIDLEYRVDNPEWDNAAPVMDTPLAGAGENDSRQPPQPFRIYRLQQSRQVRTGTLNYFDSEYLGVLVRVTEFDH